MLTPVAAHGLIYITNAHGKSSPIYAIRTGAKGTSLLFGACPLANTWRGDIEEGNLHADTARG